MSFSYSGNPGDSDLDYTRFLIQDTVTPGHLFEDEEILFQIGQSGSVGSAAIALMRTSIVKCAKLVDRTTGRIAIKWSQKAEALRGALKDLIDNVSASGDMLDIYFGGVDAADFHANQHDQTVLKPSFERGMFDNPRAAQIDGGHPLDDFEV